MISNFILSNCYIVRSAITDWCHSSMWTVAKMMIDEIQQIIISI